MPAETLGAAMQMIVDRAGAADRKRRIRQFAAVRYDAEMSVIASMEALSITPPDDRTYDELRRMAANDRDDALRANTWPKEGRR